MVTRKKFWQKQSFQKLLCLAIIAGVLMMDGQFLGEKIVSTANAASSTRYVWDKFILAETGIFCANEYESSSQVCLADGEAIYAQYGTGYTVNKTTGAITLLNRKSAYKDSEGSDYDDRGTYWYKIDSKNLVYGKLTCRRRNSDGIKKYSFDIDNPEIIACVVESTETTKGTRLGRTSNSSQFAYPTDGMTVNNWYTYLGADNIDATSLTIPGSVKGGTAISVSLSPSTQNRYGGTITYDIEGSTDGGKTWTTMRSTTSTTTTITVPRGSPTFRARVRARDNMGFTSSTYVTSNTATVINNAAPSAPGAISVPGSVKTGESFVVSWQPATDIDGNLQKYVVERSVNGGAWAKYRETPSTSFAESVEQGVTSLQYRIKAVDSEGIESQYRDSQLVNVVFSAGSRQVWDMCSIQIIPTINKSTLSANPATGDTEYYRLPSYSETCALYRANSF